jgi:hypothetical protein
LRSLASLPLPTLVCLTTLNFSPKSYCLHTNSIS